jgi:hypothetical protein
LAATCELQAEVQQCQVQQQQQLQESQRQHSSAVSVLAAAAAAVAAPQPVGPCLALSQLLLYVVLLLQQVLPVLAQMLSAGHASPAGEAVSLGVAIEQRLRAVVQQLEGLGQQAGGYQQQQDGLHAGALQLGLQLVDLCCFLLNDAAPREAVSQQLAVHAHGFVAEAGGYLTQSQQWQQQQQGEQPGPAVMLQQLTLALQHVQPTFAQAMQLA